MGCKLTRRKRKEYESKEKMKGHRYMCDPHVMQKGKRKTRWRRNGL